MYLIIIGLIAYAISEAIKSREARKAQAQAARIAAEQQRIRAEWMSAQQRAKAEAARLTSIERESVRLAREQARQAEQLAKHDKRIADLESKVRKFDRDIEAQNELLNDYYGQLDWFLLQQSGTTFGSAEFAKWQNKIVSKNNQIRKAENKMADMKDAKERAAKELVA